MSLPEASEEMQNVFSDEFKYSTYRKLWLELARAQKTFGLDISDAQLAEMEAHLEPDPNTDVDVSSQLKSYKDICQTAHSIIHLGATPSFLTENTTLIQMRTALALLTKRLQVILHQLEKLTVDHANTSSMGKQFALTLQDFLWDFGSLTNYDLPFLGVKGEMGSQVELMKLFDNDSEKVKELDKEVAALMGFAQTMTLATNLYPRKIDTYIFSMLSNIGISAHRLAKELQPSLQEPICKQAVSLISFYEKCAQIASMQTQDDLREEIIPKAFLTADTLLQMTSEALKTAPITSLDKTELGRVPDQIKELTEHLEMTDILKHFHL